MRKSVKLQLRMSELRSEINKIDPAATDAAEKRARLMSELEGIEVEFRQAVEAEEAEIEQREQRQAEGELTQEERELRELRGRVTVGNYLSAALEMRAAAGAEAEYNQAHNIGLDRFPLELLAPEPEQRATTEVDSAAMQQPWLDRLFAQTAIARLGITMRSVSPGVASFPVTTAGASAAQRGKTEATPDAAWTVGVTEMKPKRNAVRCVFSTEDASRLPGLEQALRRDLAMALTEGVDRAVFIGDDGATPDAADITGLTTAANVAETPLTQGNKVKGPETLTAFTGLVDGVHAAGLGDLNVVAAIGAYRLWEGTIFNMGADSMTIGAFLRTAGLSWSTRGEIETATTANKFAAFIGRRLGITGAGVAAMWEAGQLIRDPYSGAAKGEVALTLNYLWDFALPRPSSFARVKFT